MNQQDSKIKLHLLNGDAFVWNADDWKFLRRNYRIIGYLTGSLPRQPKQNTFQGLPLKLLPEETTLLMEKGIAELVNYDAPVIDENQLQIFNRERQNNINQQAKLIANERNQRDLSYRQQNQLPCESVEESDQGTSDDQIRKLQLSTIIHIPTAADPVHLVSTSSCGVGPIWKYPDSSSDKIRYAAYRDLWHKGFYVTPGKKFGGDYLIYADDPYLFHSQYVVRIIASENEIKMYDVITFGRLCTNVKKIGLFCSVMGDEVKYLSIKWTGMS